MRWRVAVVLLVGGLAAPAAAWAVTPRSGGAGFAPRIADTGSSGTLTRVLREGDRGADVKTLQNWLTQIGYGVPKTGYFDTFTQGAVMYFQSSHSLRPSGAVGAHLWSDGIPIRHRNFADRRAIDQENIVLAGL